MRNEVLILSLLNKFVEKTPTIYTFLTAIISIYWWYHRYSTFLSLEFMVLIHFLEEQTWWNIAIRNIPIKIKELTLFRKTTLSCKLFKDFSFSCSSVSREYEEEALKPPSSISSSKRAVLDARLSLEKKKWKKNL